MNSNQKIPGGVFQPQTLEVDEKLFDQNLRIVDSATASLRPSNDIFSAAAKPRNELLPEPDLPSITVVPDPGMCVKTKNINGEKVFINFCKVLSIPPPKPISEEALQDIIANEDYESDYRIPMSLGAPREELDKSKNKCYACDVAVNSVWYDQTMVDSLTFTTFLVTLAMEGLCNKYGDLCNLDRQNWSILRNKRYMGKPQRHTIQQRASATKIEEVNDQESLMKPLKSSIIKSKPEILLVQDPADAIMPDFIKASVKLPSIVSKNELKLEIGSDRLVLLSDAYAALDIFLPFSVAPCGAAEFHKENRELNFTMKVVQ